MSTENDIEALRAQVTAQQRLHDQAVAEVRREEARAVVLRDAMQAEFGVSILAEARSRLAELDRQAEEQAGEVRRLLERAGGSS